MAYAAMIEALKAAAPPLDSGFTLAGSARRGHALLVTSSGSPVRAR